MPLNPWRIILGIAGVVLTALITGIAIHVTVNRPTTTVIQRVTTHVTRVSLNRTQMTRKDCLALKPGLKEQDIVARYGPDQSHESTDNSTPGFVYDHDVGFYHIGWKLDCYLFYTKGQRLAEVMMDLFDTMPR